MKSSPQPSQERLPWWVFWLLLLLAYALPMAMGGWKTFKGRYLLDWNNLRTTTGTVVYSGTNGGRTPTYRIDYTYKVDGYLYQSDMATFGATAGSQRFVQRFWDKYPVGKKVTVYYDKTQPSFAVLEPRHEGSLDNLIFYVGWPVLCCLGIVGALVLQLRRQRQEAKVDAQNAQPAA